jgi:integrase
MAIMKRVLPSGLVRWRATYVDGAGRRRTKQFVRKSDADAWLVETRHSVSRGTHTAASVSPTVKEAAALWIKTCRAKGLEPLTVDGYEQHINLHINPYLGTKKLAELNTPAINAFADTLRDNGRSADMRRRVVGSLGAIFREAQQRGLASVDPTAALDLHQPDQRDDPRPIIPTKAELTAIINCATGKWRVLLLVATFCGLRSSELRGLRWQDVDFDKKVINVCQRADARHRIGRCKSKAAYRSIPVPPVALTALKEWRLACPRGEANLDLVFPNRLGRVESRTTFGERVLPRIFKAAGVQTRYAMHAFRHAAVSLWIETGHNPKKIQYLAGHSSIQITYDRYGHLFVDENADQKAAENMQAKLLGV